MSLKNELELELELDAYAKPAVEAAASANEAAARANASAANADDAAEDASASARAADSAADGADAANEAATKAARAANDAAKSAQTATEAAQEAAQTADTSAAAADEATTEATAAAEQARSAAQRIWKKADAIIDTSVRAASHTLHAQADHPLAVTLYGSAAGVSDTTIHAGDTEIALPLLPDGAPLSEGETAENWFASGCDKAITLDGSEAWVRLYAADYPALVVFIQFTDAQKSPMYYTRDFYRTSTAYTNMRNQPGCFRMLAGTENRITFAVDAALCPTLDAWKAWLAENPQTVYYTSTEYTPENELRLARVVRGGTYTYGDAGIPLYKPDTLTTDTVTVTGSGDTSVVYAHDTKHYIDSQIAAAVALALNG